MELNNTLAQIIKVSNYLIFTLSYGKYKFIYQNRECESFFETTSQPIPGLLSAVHPQDKDYLTEQLEGVNPKQGIWLECRFMTALGLRTLRINATRITESGIPVIAAIAQDITALVMQHNNLQAHGNTKNSILNILAHDLAGPIGAIGNLCELSSSQAACNNPNSAKIIDKIKLISESCIKLIQGFLHREFLDSANVVLLKKRTNLTDSLTELFKSYQEEANEIGISFISEIGKSPVYVPIDEDKFLQVVNNLISNALKFTPKGGHITLTLREHSKTVSIYLIDTGIGIPEKYHHSLFDKFTPARRKGLNGEKSTGLGMSIIKTIIDWHQGDITFTSNENNGTSFHITIPK